MIISPEAEADIAKARTYFEGLRVGLGNDFLRTIEEALNRLNRSPEAYQVVHKQVRRVRTKRFTYFIYYRVEEGEPVVFAVLYVRSNLERWKSRT